jgi:hypothetical protein
MNARPRKSEKQQRKAARTGPHERLVYDVPEAGAKLGLSRNGSYEAARRGKFQRLNLAAY